jgi:chaperonin GroES
MTKTKACPIVPLFNKVIVKREEVPSQKKSAGGIILPGDKAPPLQGTVVALGPGRMLPDGDIVKMNLEIGDTVYFNHMGLNNIIIDGEEFCVTSDSDIFGYTRS